MDRIEKHPEPYGFDIPIGLFQDAFGTAFPWLDYIFGQTQLIVKSNTSLKVPAVPLNESEYLDMLPDDNLGNFSFWVLQDPIEVKAMGLSGKILKAKASTIIWVNLEDVYESGVRKSERLTNECIDAINTMRVQQGRFEVEKVYKQAKNIFDGFDYKEISQQFLMQPFFGLRIEGTLIYKDICSI